MPRAAGGAGSLNYLIHGNKLVVIADYMEILQFMRRDREAQDFTYKAGLRGCALRDFIIL